MAATCENGYSADNPPIACGNTGMGKNMVHAMDLDPWGVDFDKPGTVGFTDDDHNNAMIYAKKRLCLEMGFHWNAEHHRAEYKKEHCSVTAVKNNNDCFGDKDNPGLHDPVGTLSLKCSKRSKLSPAYWVYANQEPQAERYCGSAGITEDQCRANVYCAWEGGRCKKADVQQRLPYSMFPYSAYNADVTDAMFEKSAGEAMAEVAGGAALSFISPLGGLAGGMVAGSLSGNVGDGASGGATDVPIQVTTSDNCDELGGSWDHVTSTCKISPYPTVSHQCVYGMGTATGSAAQSPDEASCTAAGGHWDATKTFSLEEKVFPCVVSANALSAPMKAAAKEACEKVAGEGIWDEEHGWCREIMPTHQVKEILQAKDITVKGKDKTPADSLARKNRRECQKKKGIYFTHNIPYLEYRSSQGGCALGNKLGRRFCEVPTSRTDKDNMPMDGFYDVPPWMYNSALCDESQGCTGSTPGYDGSFPFTVEMKDGNQNATKWDKSEWLCHGTRAYCDKMEVDWNKDPTGTDPGCHVSTAQSIFENIFGTTMTRNFKRDVIENAEDAYKKCGGGKSVGGDIAGAFCGAGAAIVGGFEFIGDTMVDLGKSIDKGFKAAGNWFAHGNKGKSPFDPTGWCDRRLKKNVLLLRRDYLAPGCHLYAFRWNDRAEKRIGRAGQSFGFMADEVERLYPELVRLRAAPGGGEFKSVRPQDLAALGGNAPPPLKAVLFWALNGERLGKIAEAVYGEYTGRLFRVRNNIQRCHAEVLAR